MFPIFFFSSSNRIDLKISYTCHSPSAKTFKLLDARRPFNARRPFFLRTGRPKAKDESECIVIETEVCPLARVTKIPFSFVDRRVEKEDRSHEVGLVIERCVKLACVYTKGHTKKLPRSDLTPQPFCVLWGTRERVKVNIPLPNQLPHPSLFQIRKAEHLHESPPSHLFFLPRSFFYVYNTGVPSVGGFSFFLTWPFLRWISHVGKLNSFNKV